MFPFIDKIFILDADDFLSNQTTDQTRVPAQKVYNSWFDRWILLKFLQEFPVTVLFGIAMKSLLDNQSSVPAQ